MDLHVRLPKDLGCTMASTAVLKALKDSFPGKRLIVHTHLSDLVENLSFIDEIGSSETFISSANSLNLFDYSRERNVLEARPYRHLIDHMYEAAEEVFGVSLDRNHRLHFHPSDNDLQEAKEVLDGIDEDKPIVWTRKKTSRAEKDLPQEFWQGLESSNKDRYTFLELDERYSRRLAITLTKLCHAGVVLDTFLSHGSQAVEAPNVIVLLVNTRPEIVTYPNQHALYNPEQAIVPELVTEELRRLI